MSMAGANVAVTCEDLLKSPRDTARDTMSLQVTAHTSVAGRPIFTAMHPAEVS